MDTTAINQKIAALQSQVTVDENTLATDQATLAQAQAELAQASLINAIEALEDVSAINAALKADNSKWEIIDTTPVAAPLEAPVEATVAE